MRVINFVYSCFEFNKNAGYFMMLQKIGSIDDEFSRIFPFLKPLLIELDSFGEEISGYVHIDSISKKVEEPLVIL